MKKLILLLILILSSSCFALQKNVASQKWVVFAFDETDNTAKTGDSASITANVRIDGAAADAVDDEHPTELEDGYYIFDITATESNGECIVICPASETANIQVIGCPMCVYTTPANFPDFSVSATNGRVDIIKVAGTTQTANDMSGDVDDILVDTGTTLDDFIDTEVASLVAFWNVFILTSGTIGAVGNDTTHLHMTGLSYGDDELNDYIVVVYDNSETEYHSVWVTDWDNAAALATVETMAFTPEDLVDPYWVFSMKKHPDVSTILTDTGTTLDTLIKDIPTSAEFALRSLLTADYTVVGDLGTVQSGDSFAIVNGVHGLVSIQDDIDEVLTDTGTTLDTIVDSILADTGTDGVVLAADSVDSASVHSDALDAILMADLAPGAPSATATIKVAINWIYSSLINKFIENGTNSELEYYNNAGTKIAESDVSDDGTDFTRGKMGAID